MLVVIDGVTGIGRNGGCLLRYNATTASAFPEGWNEISVYLVLLPHGECLVVRRLAPSPASKLPRDA